MKVLLTEGGHTKVFLGILFLGEETYLFSFIWWYANAGIEVDPHCESFAEYLPAYRMYFSRCKTFWSQISDVLDTVTCAGPAAKDFWKSLRIMTEKEQQKVLKLKWAPSPEVRFHVP